LKVDILRVKWSWGTLLKLEGESIIFHLDSDWLSLIGIWSKRDMEDVKEYVGGV
jgi:hypothetical protein